MNLRYSVKQSRVNSISKNLTNLVSVPHVAKARITVLAFLYKIIEVRAHI